MDRNRLFNDNINLAYKFATKYYKTFGRDDAIQISLLGLWKACCTYDESKNITLGTYSYKIMMNEFYMQFRDLKKKEGFIDISIEEIIYDNIKISDTLYDEYNNEDKIIDNMDTNRLRDIINEELKLLSSRNRYIINMYLNGVTQMKIANKIGLSQASVSRTIKSFCDNMKSKYKKDEG